MNNRRINLITDTVRMAIIILIKHRANITRLIHGEEPVMGIFKKKDETETTETEEGEKEDE